MSGYRRHIAVSRSTAGIESYLCTCDRTRDHEVQLPEPVAQPALFELDGEMTFSEN